MLDQTTSESSVPDFRFHQKKYLFADHMASQLRCQGIQNLLRHDYYHRLTSAALHCIAKKKKKTIIYKKKKKKFDDENICLHKRPQQCLQNDQVLV